MKQTFLLLSVFFTCLSTFNLQAQRTKVNGDGNLSKQTRSVGSFNKIASQGSFDIVLKDDADFKVEVEAEGNIQEYIIVDIEGDRLRIRGKNNVNLHPTKSVTVYVSAPALESVHLSGSGNVKSVNLLDGSKSFDIKSSGSGNVNLEVETSNMEAAISGSGNITLKGKTKELEGSISGSGNIRAKEMQSEITSVKIAGSGSAEVVATSKLNSKIAGSGDVRYWGDASVDSKVAGSGSVRKEN